MTLLAHMIEARLGRNLEDRIAGERKSGKSWSTIAREIRDQTGLKVSGEAMRKWTVDECQSRMTKELRTLGAFEKIGLPLHLFISDARKEGVSWRGIAASIERLTGIHVSHETVRVWAMKMTRS